MLRKSVGIHLDLLLVLLRVFFSFGLFLKSDFVGKWNLWEAGLCWKLDSCPKSYFIGCWTLLAVGVWEKLKFG